MQDFEAKSGQFCVSLGKDSQSLTAAELYSSLLRLVTRGKWTIDASGQLTSSGLLKNLFQDQALQVYGFTNRDADPTTGAGAKIYSNLYPLSEDLDKFYASWTASILGAAGGGGGALSYVEAFHPGFLSNLASAYSIRNWKLKGARLIQATGEYPSRDAVGSTRYRFTFEAPGGNLISLDFSPTDRIFFCSYDPAGQTKTKLVAIAGEPVAPMSEYKIDYSRFSCPPGQGAAAAGGGALPGREQTVEQIVNSIISNARRADGTWSVVSRDSFGLPTAWKAKTKADAKVINAVFGYKYGVPTLEPNPGDHLGLRLIRMEKIGNIGIAGASNPTTLWKLTLDQVNRETFFRTPSIDVFVTSTDRLGLCA
jgi:hypothetical protein